LHNGRIYRNSEDNYPASAIVISNGRIVGIGNEQLIDSLSETNTDIIDLEGDVVLPGFTDAHIHLTSYALSLQKIDCETKTRNECIKRLYEKVQIVPHGEWILGHGWNQNVWVDGLGGKEELDSITTRHPVYLTAKSLHAAWVNSQALLLAGIDENTPDPSDGHIGKDSQGKLNGILYEGAMKLVADFIPEPSLSQVMDAVGKAQERLLAFGITGVHDFDGRQCTLVLQELKQQGKLLLRVLKSIPYEHMEDAIGLGLESGFGDDFLRFGHVKLFADGALGTRTAAMFEPYNDRHNNKGMLFLTRNDLINIGEKAMKNGLQLAVHAIGDKANHEVLNAFEVLIQGHKRVDNGVGNKWANGKNSMVSQRRAIDPRLRIEHAQLLKSEDIDRFGKMNIVASMQPIHAISDIEAAKMGWGDRSRTSYAWASLINSGAVLAFGSDAPVESPNPFWGIWASVTRRKIDRKTDENGWYPQQRISARDAVRAYTKGPAIAAGMENKLGEIKVGLYADLIVLGDDIFHCNHERLLDMRPKRVMINGNWVYER